MEQHPKFQEVQRECSLYPDYAEQLFQVYLDLTQATAKVKDFEHVQVIQTCLLKRHFIEGVNPDNNTKYLILPSLITEVWTVAKINAIFEALANEQDPRLNSNTISKITVGIIATDSTITYLNLSNDVPVS